MYLCPRKLKRRLAIDPESLVPKLPDLRDLKPFPNALCRAFVGHTCAVVALDVSRDGQWLARIQCRIQKARIWSRRGFPSLVDRRRLSARELLRPALTHWPSHKRPRPGETIDNYTGDGGRRRPRFVVGGVHREVNEGDGGPGALVSVTMEPACRAPRLSCCWPRGCVSRGHENGARR